MSSRSSPVALIQLIHLKMSWMKENLQTLPTALLGGLVGFLNTNSMLEELQCEYQSSVSLRAKHCCSADDTSSVQPGLLKLASRLDWSLGCSSYKLIHLSLLLLLLLLFLIVLHLQLSVLAVSWLLDIPQCILSS